MTPADLDARLGAVIRRRRILLGLIQKGLADRIGIAYQQLQKHESGANQVSFCRLLDLAKALEISVSDLITAVTVDEAPLPDGLSDSESLELLKRLASLTPNQRRGVQLLVNSLAEGV